MAKTANKAKDAMKEFSYELSRILPTDYLVEHFYAQGLLSSEHKTRLKSFTTRKDKTEYFLEEVLERSIDVGYTEQFDEMLYLMENSDDRAVKFLVLKIQVFVAQNSSTFNFNAT